MPGASGMDLLEQIKSKSPDIEVIIMTGMSTPDGQAEAKITGAFGYIAKPFSYPDEPLDKVKAAMEKRRE